MHKSYTFSPTLFAFTEKSLSRLCTNQFDEISHVLVPSKFNLFDVFVSKNSPKSSFYIVCTERSEVTYLFVLALVLTQKSEVVQLFGDIWMIFS